MASLGALALMYLHSTGGSILVTAMAQSEDEGFVREDKEESGEEALYELSPQEEEGEDHPPEDLPPEDLPPEEETPPPFRGTLVFVIDDAGYSLFDLEPFLQFPGPLTIAVLPGRRDSAEAARRIRDAGKELLLHQPMEALARPPEPGAILAGMDPEEIIAIISRNLEEIGPVAGMNNHEGSRATQDEEGMKTILALCQERGLFFLDSRTVAESVAPRLARELGLTIGVRDIFIDNIQTRESMLGFINSGLVRAEATGSAIMIGHVWSPALAPLLTEIYPELIRLGFTFSTLADLLGEQDESPGY